MKSIYPFWVGSISEGSNVSANMDSKDDDGKVMVDLSFFTSNKAEKIDDGLSYQDKEKKEKRNKVKIVQEGEIPNEHGLTNPIPGSNVAEVDYARSYNETNNLIRGAIIQADELSQEIKQDIDTVRSSKTIKNKYTYVTNLTASASALLSTKISAIKELNSTITQAHNLELNRMKTLKLNESEGNDDMKMMDIYSAFVNTPIGSYVPPAPNVQDLTLGVNSQNSTVSAIEMVAARPEESRNLTPEQNRMRMESNTNIQTVVRYDQTTGQRCFDVIDKNTMMSVPNYPRPDAFLLEDTTIDVHSGIARNRNINTVWPLILEGSNKTINEY